MPIIIVLLLAILIAQFGFWDTFEGVLGAVAMLILLATLSAALLALAGWYTWRRMTTDRGRRLDPPGSGPLPRVDPAPGRPADRSLR